MNVFDFNKRYLPTGTTLDILNLETREKEYWSLYNNQLSKDIETWYSDKNKKLFTKLTPIEKKNSQICILMEKGIIIPIINLICL